MTDVLPQRLERVERLIREMEEGPESPLRGRARQLLAAVLDLHADALRVMIDGLAASDDGQRAFDAWARDPRVSAVLLLHGLHPIALEARVHGALEALAPTLRDHGARVAAVGIADAIVRVRVDRAASRAATPASALRARLEDALVAAAPDAAAIEVDVPDSPAAFVPVDQVRLRSRVPEAGTR